MAHFWRKEQCLFKYLQGLEAPDGYEINPSKHTFANVLDMIY